MDLHRCPPGGIASIQACTARSVPSGPGSRTRLPPVRRPPRPASVTPRTGRCCRWRVRPGRLGRRLCRWTIPGPQRARRAAAELRVGVRHKSLFGLVATTQAAGRHRLLPRLGERDGGSVEMDLGLGIATAANAGPAEAVKCVGDLPQQQTRAILGKLGAAQDGLIAADGRRELLGVGIRRLASDRGPEPGPRSSRRSVRTAQQPRDPGPAAHRS